MQRYIGKGLLGRAAAGWIAALIACGIAWSADPETKEEPMSLPMATCSPLEWKVPYTISEVPVYYPLKLGNWWKYELQSVEPAGAEKSSFPVHCLERVIEVIAHPKRDDIKGFVIENVSGKTTSVTMHCIVAQSVTMDLGVAMESYRIGSGSRPVMNCWPCPPTWSVRSLKDKCLAGSKL